MMEVSIIQKPAHWFAEQINGLVFIGLGPMSWKLTRDATVPGWSIYFFLTHTEIGYLKMSKIKKRISKYRTKNTSIEKLTEDIFFSKNKKLKNKKKIKSK